MAYLRDIRSTCALMLLPTVLLCLAIPRGALSQPGDPLRPLGGSGSGSTPLIGCGFANQTNYNFTLTTMSNTEVLTIGKLFYFITMDNVTSEYLELEADYYYAESDSERRQLEILYNEEGLVIYFSYAFTASTITDTITIVVNSPQLEFEGIVGLCPLVDITVDVTLLLQTTPPECTMTSYELAASQFDSISETFKQLECSTTAQFGIVYNIATAAGQLTVYQDRFLPIFADYFGVGNHSLVVTICNSVFGNCNEMTVSIALTVNPHPDRLFPFGLSYGQYAIEYADDSVRSVYVTNGIPFWNRYYSRVYVSTNGLISFTFPYTSWYPVEFPYGRRQIPVIAPYWTDLDFRNSLGSDSAVFYQTYTRGSGNTGDSLLDTFALRLSRYSMNSQGETTEYEPEWMLVVTWYQATPYYGRLNEDETISFQLVLATDYVRTYAFYLYQEDGFNWDNASRQHQRIGIGYDAKDYINYDNIELPSRNDLLTIDKYTGNTNEAGQWYFNFSSSDTDANFDQLCIEWSKRQQPNTMEYFSALSLPSCPCTQWQAWRDWRFWFAYSWGYSSQPNCATLLFSRTQSTIECCYSTTDGSLLVGPNDGGTYKLYNSLFHPEDHHREDLLPYEYCCRFSERCSTYYQHRPSDDCSNYRPLRRLFMWGDPHFRSVDDNTFTFNGIGDYVLLESVSNGLQVHGRFARYNNTNATVMIALTMRQNNSQVVRVEVQSVATLQLYVGDDLYPIPENNSGLWVTETDVYTAASQLGPDISDANMITIRPGNDTLLLSTPDGASVSVSVQVSFLHSSVGLSDAYLGATRGLLGTYNSDPSDDFTLPNGTVLPQDLMDEEVHYQFGLEWHLNETSTLLPSDLYADHNDGWDTFVPFFLSTTQDPSGQCGGDLSCIFDYSVTGDITIGLTSMEISVENNNTLIGLDNHPPNITGPTVLFAEAGVVLNETYTVSDDGIGGGVIEFRLKEPIPDGFSLVGTNNSSTLIWANPGYNLPNGTIQLLATDSLDAPTTITISIILCACDNGGTCNVTGESFPLNVNQHYKVPCNCPQDNFTGDSCEIATRGCELDPCPEFSQCTADEMAPDGYTCTCLKGHISNEEGKCVDINECNTTVPEHQNNCSQICVNTAGGYECDCEDGYRLGEDLVTCLDIDECSEALDNCEVICTNTNGSFECDCLYPGTLSTNPLLPGRCLLDTTNCGDSVCSGGICALGTTTDVVCLCHDGEQCMGVCEGTTSELNNGNQTCVPCPSDRYGFNCSMTCGCVNGYCDPSRGCRCDEGWAGLDCSIEINNYDPEFLVETSTGLDLPWDLPAGSIVARISARDNDTNPNSGTVSYFLREAPLPLTQDTSDGLSVFQIDNSTGVLTLTENLNANRGIYERFFLTIEARDGGESPRSAVTTLTIVPIDTAVPEPIFTEGQYVVHVPESTLVNSTILVNVTCTETNPLTDPTDLVIMLVGGNGTDVFAFEEDSVIVLIQELDYETLPTVYTLDFRCTNPFALTGDGSVLIIVRNVDDNPFIFENTSYVVTIPENISTDEVVLRLRAFDADEPNVRIDYNDLPQINEFVVVAQTGEVKVEAKLDREVVSNYTLMVQAHKVSGENVGATVNTTVYIFLSDVNDNRPVFDPPFYVSTTLSTRNKTGDIVTTVRATDPDQDENGIVAYALEANPYLSINETTGVIQIVTEFNSSLRADWNVTAFDGGQPPLFRVTRLEVIVMAAAERVEFEDFRFTVFEDRARGSVIGDVSAKVINADGQQVQALNSELQYELVESVPNGSVDIFHVVRDTGHIILLSSLDYDFDDQLYILRINASLANDPVVSTVTNLVQIEVLNVNDNAPQFSSRFYVTTIEEFTPAGTSVRFDSSIEAFDNDRDNITYSVEGVAPFSIDSVTGNLTVSDTLDTPHNYRFAVVATDNGNPPLSSEAVVIISVVRSASVTPHFNQPNGYNFHVSEYALPGSVVGSVLANTEGNRSISLYPHLIYGIRIPDLNDTVPYFHIDETFGNISSLLPILDAETQEIYNFYVDVYDLNTNQTLTFVSVEVEIIDENDNPPEFSDILYTAVIRTSAQQNSTILTVSATDPDTNDGEEIMYTLSSNSALGFAVDKDTGAIRVHNSTLFVGEYRLTVNAIDGSESDTAVLLITVIPATPARINFSLPVYEFEVPEDAPANTVVGQVQAVDHEGTVITEYLTYTLISNHSCFIINLLTGNISVACTTLDRDKVSSYQLAVAATYDNGNISYSEAVAVYVALLDINDNHPRFLLDVYSKVIREDHNSSVSVITITATDPDSAENGTVTYALYEDAVSQTESSLFRINSSTGAVFPVNSIVPVGDYRLVAVARDQGDPPLQSMHSALVLICVTPAAPVALAFNGTDLYVYENEEAGTIVGLVMLLSSGEPLNPYDFPDNLNFMITGTGESSELFHINPINGTVQTVTNLDREDITTHLLTVEAYFSQFNIAVSGGVVIHVLDRNDETPVFMPGIYSAIIDDSYEIGQLVITSVFARDRDSGTNAAITYSIESGTPFGINETTGDIFVANNSLVVGEHRFTISATDMGSNPLMGTAQVYVIVEHAVPKQISFPPSPYNFNHTENSEPGTTVGTVAIEQVTPALDGVVYEVTGGTGALFFQVTPFTGNIQNFREVDREENSQLNLTVRAYLPGSMPELSANTTVDITIVDENDNRPLFQPSYYSVTNFTTIPINTPIVKVSATDADEGSNQDIEFNVVDSVPFDINAEGEVFANTQLTAGIYYFVVTATDKGDPPQTGSADVLVNIREPVPEAIRFEMDEYVFSTSEGTLSGDLVGTVQLALNDIPERLHQDINYETTSVNFTVGPTTGEVRSRIGFDFEAQQSYTFTVEAHVDTLSVTATVTVNIEDENDNRPEFVDFPSAYSMPENMLSETSVLTIEATDRDSGSNAQLVFEITNDVNSNFRINSSTGILYAAASLDRELQDTYMLNIQVTDMGVPPLSNEDLIQITLLDVNDNKPVLTSGTEYEVRERTPAGEQVFTLTFEDADSGNFATVRVSLVSDADGRFTVDSTTGVVSLRQELDYEAHQNHTLTILLEDNIIGSPADRLDNQYTILVLVIDEPDNAPRFALASYLYTINPMLPGGEVIGGVEASDDDGDLITFSIVGREVTQGSDPLPLLSIGNTNGVITSTSQQTFTTESEFQVTVEAIDDSRWSLTSTVVVTIEVVPISLQFTQSSYSSSISENANIGTTVDTLSIDPLTISSDITYSISVVDSLGRSANSKFSTIKLGTGVAIRLNQILDREEVDSYIIEVTANRPADHITQRPADTTSATLSVTVLDYNDNSPRFTDGTSPIMVEENTPSQTVVGRANAVDDDIGENARLQFSLVNPPVSLPFDIDPDDGDIIVVGTVDYEISQLFTFTVQARDQGSPPTSATFTYTINVTNMNDNFPAFAAPAYFGEVYAGAPNNYRVHFVVLEISDDDDPQNKQHITFEITLNAGLGITGYELQVADREPYYIVAVRIPDGAQTGIVEFSVQVMDEGGLVASVPLYLSIFTSNYLVAFDLTAVSEEQFLSCEDDTLNSVCGFTEKLSVVVSDILDIRVTYYNDSVEVSESDTSRLIVTTYGWKGRLTDLSYGRHNKGIISSGSQPPPVEYIEYAHNLSLQAQIAQAAEDDFNEFIFGVDPTNVEPTMTTTEEESPGFFEDTVNVVIISVVIIVALLIVLAIVVILVFGMRRKREPTRKRDADPYDRDYTQSRSRRRPRKARTPHKGGESIALTTGGGGSDLAYETMYDDDEVLGTQTMPWFNPEYFASEKDEDRHYEGDTENNHRSATTSPTHGKAPVLRATVDGDARRGRRRSSDESSREPVSDLDQTDYLKGYQQSTPMRPGQQMGELDMFAQPRDPDRPARPSLDHYTWDQQHKTSQM